MKVHWSSMSYVEKEMFDHWESIDELKIYVVWLMLFHLDKDDQRGWFVIDQTKVIWYEPLTVSSMTTRLAKTAPDPLP